MSSISLCMIAKNEEQLIAQAILSVLPVVNEVILVDTGSSDKTVEIADSLGAKVFHLPWQDDFSAPRNLSLSKAAGDWILVLDADEAIAAEDHDVLKSMTKDPSICWEFMQRHYTEDQRLSGFTPLSGQYPSWEKGQGGYLESNCVRMFPNGAGISYRGLVHELVEHSIAEINRHKIIRTEVRIHHYGHTQAVKSRKDKHNIYTRLGEAKVADTPMNWKSYFELGVEHNNNGRYQESEAALKQAAVMNPQYVECWVNLGYVQCELKKYEQAVESLKIALTVNPRSASAYCNLGVVMLRSGKLEAAENSFRRAIALEPKYINAFCNLGLVLASAGRITEAVNWYQRALELFPQLVRANEELGVLYLNAGMLELAERHLLYALAADPCRSLIHFHLGLIYHAAGKTKQALTSLTEFCRQRQAITYKREMEEAARIIEQLQGQ